jgi:hypothetical protein
MCDGSVRSAVLEALPELGAPAPAMGHTPERWSAMFDLAAIGDVTVARLVEAHLDAVAILHEAGRSPRPGSLYGVWASVRPDGIDVELDGDRLTGTKSFCSGVGFIDRALIDLYVDGSRRLADVGVDVGSDDPAVRGEVVWHHRGLASANTGTVRFDRHDDVELVAPPGWYLDRPGFWHGAVGPAACWAGAAAGLARSIEPSDDPYRTAACGAITADVWTMCAVLEQAGRDADRWPADRNGARHRALAARHAVHELATNVVDRFTRAAGPRPLVADSSVAQRVADVEIYLRQHHGERDLAALAGCDVRASRVSDPASEAAQVPRA